MNTKNWIVILIVASILSCSQTEKDINSGDDHKHLINQLKDMRKLFLAKDFENFANYTYPKLIELVGGKSKMIEGTRKAMDGINDKGFFILDLGFENPTRLLKKGNELQCSITQIMIMQTPSGKLKTESTLIAISSDNGQNWTFLDTSGKDKEVLLKSFPNLSEEIIINPSKKILFE